MTDTQHCEPRTAAEVAAAVTRGLDTTGTVVLERDEVAARAARIAADTRPQAERDAVAARAAADSRRAADRYREHMAQANDLVILSQLDRMDVGFLRARAGARPAFAAALAQAGVTL